MQHFASAMLAFGIMAPAVSPARADPPTTCSTTVTGGTIDGNVVVSGSNFCTLQSVTVTGNVRVGTGARLIVRGGKVGGNIYADGCEEVILDNLFGGSLSVGGNVQIQACTGFAHHFAATIVNYGTSSSLIDIGGNLQCNDGQTGAGHCDVEFVTIGGNVQVDDNAGGAFVSDNSVGGNMDVNNNDGATVTGNTVNGNLVCQGNTSLTASGNTVHGNTHCP